LNDRDPSCLNINVTEGKKRDMTWGSYQWILMGIYSMKPGSQQFSI